jgi:hypothetical protein
MSMLHQPTPTQRQAAERRRAFHASIAARAAARMQAPAPVEFKVVVAAPAPTQELPAQAFPAEPDPPAPGSWRPWFWMAGGDFPFNSIDVIQRLVCDRFRISLVQINGPIRVRQFVRPRQIAMFICHRVAQKSYPEIARRFGNRDHTTALAAVRRVSTLMSEDLEFAETVNELIGAVEQKIFK